MPLTIPKFNFFGSTQDVRDVIRSIYNKRPRARIFMLGISAGSGLVARYMGEQGQLECTIGNRGDGLEGVTDLFRHTYGYCDSAIG